MSEEEKPSSGAGWSKIGAAGLASVVPVIGPVIAGSMLADKDVRETAKATSLGGVKAVAGSFGKNAVHEIMGRVNMAGAALDAVRGDDGENSAGRVLGREVRGEMARIESENPGSVLAGGVAGTVATSMLPGGAGGINSALTVGAGKLAGSMVARKVPSLAANMAVGAGMGVVGTAQDKFIENANAQALKEGHVDYGKAVAATMRGDGMLESAALGAALPLAGKAIGGTASFLKKAKGLADDVFLIENGLDGGQRKAIREAAGDKLASLLDDVRTNKEHGAGVVKKLTEELDGHLEVGRSNLRSQGERISAAAERKKSVIAESFNNEVAAQKAKLDADDMLKLEALAAKAEAVEGSRRAVGADMFQAKADFEDAVAAFKAKKMEQIAAIKSRPLAVDHLREAELAEQAALMAEKRKIVKAAMAEERLGLDAFGPSGKGLRGARRAGGAPANDLSDPVAEINQRILDSQAKWDQAMEAARLKHEADIAKRIAPIEEQIGKAEDILLKENPGKALSAAQKRVEQFTSRYEKDMLRLEAEREAIQQGSSGRLEKIQAQQRQRQARMEAAVEAQARAERAKIEEALSKLDAESLTTSAVDEIVKKHGYHTIDPVVVKDILLRRRVVEALGEAKSKSLKHSGVALFNTPGGARAAVLGRLFSKGPLAAAGGFAGGWIGAAAGTAADVLLGRIAPHYQSNHLRAVGSLAAAIDHTLTMDQVVKGAVDTLFGKSLPLASGKSRPEGKFSEAQDPGKAISDHAAELGRITANPENFERAVQATAGHLHPDGQAAAASKLGSIIANVRQRMPKPAIEHNPIFGQQPKYSTSDIHKYEDYVMVAFDPSAYARAIRGRYVTPEMTQAMKDNWPEVYSQFQKETFEAMSRTSAEDTQSVRHVETMFGEAILPENKPENTKFFQNFYDAKERENQPGSQGGGSPAAASKNSSQTSKLPSDRMGLVKP